MSKLAAMRATLNHEERNVYEKYRTEIQKPAGDEARSEISDDAMDMDDSTNDPENGAAGKHELNRKTRKLARFPPGSVQPDYVRDQPDYSRSFRSRPQTPPGRGGDHPGERREIDRDRGRRTRSTSRDRGRRPRSSSRERGRRVGRSPERRSHRTRSRSRSPRLKRSRSRSL